MENKNGQPQRRITDDEIHLIRDVFKGNDVLLKLMRKIFLPEYDPSAPLGQTVDLLGVKDVSNMSPEEVKIYYLARRDMIMHLESCLLQLQSLAETPLETLEELNARLAKNSNK